ncbi:hypothetical protein K438DRAFT_1867604 [Mycena galopus ATCC 62051]|nr:hypothetical protein K438DRAFT_1867604 [Mycena galopus ATCC 62051]
MGSRARISFQRRLDRSLALGCQLQECACQVSAQRRRAHFRSAATRRAQAGRFVGGEEKGAVNACVNRGFVGGARLAPGRYMCMHSCRSQLSLLNVVLSD